MHRATTPTRLDPRTSHHYPGIMATPTDYKILTKNDLATVAGTNMQVDFIYISGELKFIELKVLPLSTGIVYRVSTLNFSTLQAMIKT